jgi:hypothetical protein
MIRSVFLIRFIFLLCLIIAGRATWPGSLRAQQLELSFSDPMSSEVLLRLCLQPDETFTIRYIHSVDQTPVFEIFGSDPYGVLALQATYFKMFGAGMGHLQGRGVVDFDGEWTWIRDINESLGSFILRIGAPPVAHTLLYRGEEINLSEKWPRRRVLVKLAQREPENNGLSSKRAPREGGDD